VTELPPSAGRPTPLQTKREGIDLSIVIPAYNEERRIVPTIEAIAAYLARTATKAEILVVDDGSADRTAARVGELTASIPSLRLLGNGRNRGKGFSIRHGFSESRAPLVLLTDADLSTPIEEVEKLIPSVRDGKAGVAVGSRALAPELVEVRQGPLRQAMGKGFNLLVRTLTGLSIRDTQCGFKLMDRRRLAPVFAVARVDRFSYDVEILYLAHRRGIRIEEIPVIWRDSPNSRVSLFGDPLQMFVDVVRIVWRDRAGRSRAPS
jgi:dolichyl-phosphate beta-glucosyltransferase